jgi:membrane protein
VTGPLIALGLGCAPYILLWSLFALIYLIMPNTKVRVRHAFPAAVLAGTAYQLLQIAYVRFQIGMTSYNAIYGSFAALPLFLLWLNISWHIVLFGAEIVRALEQAPNPGLPAGKKQELRPAEMRLYALLLCAHVARRFQLGLTAQSPAEIARELNIPSDLADQMGDRLVQAKILVSIADSDASLQPAMDVQNMTPSRVLEALDHVGESFMAADMHPMIAPISTHLDALRTAMEESSANLPILEIMKAENIFKE